MFALLVNLQNLLPNSISGSDGFFTHMWGKITNAFTMFFWSLRSGITSLTGADEAIGDASWRLKLLSKYNFVTSVNYEETNNIFDYVFNTTNPEENYFSLNQIFGNIHFICGDVVWKFVCGMLLVGYIMLLIFIIRRILDVVDFIFVRIANSKWFQHLDIDNGHRTNKLIYKFMHWFGNIRG